MDKKKKIILIVSLVFSLIVIGAAVAVAQSQKKQKADTGSGQVTQRPVTKAELAKATGKDGNKCYVAVDDTVYEIKDFSLWQNGEHKPSGGQAYCGADMSAVIDKAPHGRRILDVLIKVGPLKG
jgi:predicted heme/steroid binding protein